MFLFCHWYLWVDFTTGRRKVQGLVFWLCRKACAVCTSVVYHRCLIEPWYALKLSPTISGNHTMRHTSSHVEPWSVWIVSRVLNLSLQLSLFIVHTPLSATFCLHNWPQHYKCLWEDTETETVPCCFHACQTTKTLKREKRRFLERSEKGSTLDAQGRFSCSSVTCCCRDYVFCRPTSKLALHRVPLQKGSGMNSLTFGLLQKISSDHYINMIIRSQKRITIINTLL